MSNCMHKKGSNVVRYMPGKALCLCHTHTQVQIQIQTQAHAAIMDEEVASVGTILPPPPPQPEETRSWQASLLEKLGERKQHIVHFVVCEGHDQAVKDFVWHATESKVCLEVPEKFCKTSTSLMKWTDKYSKTGAYILHSPSGKGYRANIKSSSITGAMDYCWVSNVIKPHVISRTIAQQVLLMLQV
jgi:hypothetical protein